MADKNPTHPDDSPIRTEHSGGWNNAYRNYVSSTPKPQHGLKAKVYGRDNSVAYSSPAEYTKSKTEDAQIDAALDAAINRDLNQRNIPKPKKK